MAPAPTLEVQDVTFAYAEQSEAVNRLSLRVKAGDRLALLGQNGSGKTTLAKLMAGLLEPAAGRVLIDNQNVHSLTPGQRAHKIGYVFQNPDHQIFSQSVRQELSFGPRNLGLRDEALDQRVESTLQQFELEPVAELSPATLNYGDRRKVTVAAVAAMRCPILILDEPSLGLDWGSATGMLDRLLLGEHAPAILILISHDLDLAARYSQQAALLAQGQLVQRGAAGALLANGDLLRQHGMQPTAIPQLAASLRQQGLPIEAFETESFARSFASLMTGATK